MICTGNICRSAYAAALAEQLMPGFRLISAGTRAVTDGRVPDELLAVSSATGVDLRPHRARQLNRTDVVNSDLILGLAREHRSAAVRLHPRSARYAFSLREFSRLAADYVDPADAPRGENRADRARRLVREIASRRGLVDPAPRPEDDDIADPMGGGPAVHRATVFSIAPTVERLAALLCDTDYSTSPASSENGRPA
jgi:protein-tyrosine phosphatase